MQADEELLNGLTLRPCLCGTDMEPQWETVRQDAKSRVMLLCPDCVFMISREIREVELVKRGRELLLDVCLCLCAQWNAGMNSAVGGRVQRATTQEIVVSLLRQPYILRLPEHSMVNFSFTKRVWELTTPDTVVSKHRVLRRLLLSYSCICED